MLNKLLSNLFRIRLYGRLLKRGFARQCKLPNTIWPKQANMDQRTSSISACNL